MGLIGVSTLTEEIIITVLWHHTSNQEVLTLCLSRPQALWTTLSKFTVQIFLSSLLIVNCSAAYPAKGDQWHFSCGSAVKTNGGTFFTESLR